MASVAVVGIVGLPACYGGFESLVENLTHDASEEIEYSVFCSSKVYENKRKSHNGAELIYIPMNANGFQSVVYDFLCLVYCLFKKPDVTLILGVSGCIFLPFYRFFSSSKIITNIDGLEWKRAKWNKWASRFLKFSESLAVKYSDVIITDNQAIGEYVKAEYSKDSLTIAYGGDHVISQDFATKKNSGYYFSLCRIEPENNVQMILEAFSGSTEYLKFVGNWDASEFGRVLKAKYKNLANIELIDPVYDINFLFTIRNECKAYIHGHSAGGTNPSLVEAMHFEKAIFAYDCDFNRFTTEDKASYFDSAEHLRLLIGNAKEHELEVIAKQMKLIAEERYTWCKINKMYEKAYSL